MIRRYQVLLLAAVMLLAGCSDKPVIPARKMASIFHDMYLLDAQLDIENSFRNMADTSSVYGAVFAEYGYSEDDFRSALDYYLHHPVQLKEVIAMGHKRFDEEIGKRELDPASVDFDDFEQPVQPQPRTRTRRLRRASEPSSNDNEQY